MTLKLYRAVLALVAMWLLTVSAWAETYVDEMASLDSNNIHQYSGLAAIDMSHTAWSALPDRTALTFASYGNPTGSVTYRIQNAQQITVAIYSQSGTFVSERVDRPGAYAMGAYQADLSGISGKPLTQASYSAQNRLLYTRVGGQLHRIFYDGTYYATEPSTDSPSGLVGYGVNVYASGDGGSYSSVNLSYSSLQYQQSSPFVYEELSGSIPSSAKYVRVEINDVTRFPTATGHIDKTPMGMTCLASVSLTGSNLILGIPEEVVSEPGINPNPGDGDEGKSKGGAGTGGVPSQSAGASSTASSAASSPSGSKFEGTITSPGTGGGTGSRAASQPPEDPRSREESTEGEAPERGGQDDLFEIPRQQRGSDRAFTVGIVVYIVLVAGAMLFVMLRPKK